MRAAIYTRYGTPEVLHLKDLPSPTPAPDELLVEVMASPITQGDRRLRSADFPGMTWLPGRLMFGLFSPRRHDVGTMFAGRIIQVGAAVTEFAVGDDVFGSCMHGAHAELLTINAKGVVTHMPTSLSYAEAAALPYGAETALHFLEGLAALSRGQRALIIGAAGGVGVYAVQIARCLGAHVSAVAGTTRGERELLASLGADEVIDYRVDDYLHSAQPYDVILDTSGKASFDQCKQVLTDTGRFLSLDINLRLLHQLIWTSRSEGKRAIFGTSMGDKALLERVRDLAEQGALRAVIGAQYPLDQLVAAHERLDQGGISGTLVLSMPNPPI